MGAHHNLHAGSDIAEPASAAQEPQQLDRRLLWVLATGLVIAAVTMHRLSRPPRGAIAGGPALCFAPPFEAIHHRSSSEQFRLVKLRAYLGRTRIALVFYDGFSGADQDPWLVQLRDASAAVEAAGVQVIGVSTATPYANRQAEDRSRPFPFPLLSDLAAAEQPPPIHQQWNLGDAALVLSRAHVGAEAGAGTPGTSLVPIEPQTPDLQTPDGDARHVPALFLIDRAGRVACDSRGPLPHPAPAAAVAALVQGHWPSWTAPSPSPGPAQ